jgi:hypothetical protein
LAFRHGGGQKEERAPYGARFAWIAAVDHWGMVKKSSARRSAVFRLRFGAFHPTRHVKKVFPRKNQQSLQLAILFAITNQPLSLGKEIECY